jgi:Tfp pilus assembly protein PilN
VSKNLPDFLWLERMAASDNAISIVGKATTYNAVSNFYNNLKESGFFTNVTLGRTYEAQEGVIFSLSCAFVVPQQPQERPQEGDEPETQG